MTARHLQDTGQLYYCLLIKVIDALIKNVHTQFWSEKLKHDSAWSMLCGVTALCLGSDYLVLNNSEVVMTGADVLVACQGSVLAVSCQS